MRLKPTLLIDLFAGTCLAAILQCGCTPSLPAPKPVLFVADFTAVTSYGNPAALQGDVSPTTNLAGMRTQLSGAADVAVNAAGQLLVCNFEGNSITVYADALNADGDQAPIHNVSGPQTLIAKPQSIAVDPSRDLAYVFNYPSGPVLVFSGSSTSTFNGNVPPLHAITSALFNKALTIRLDGADNLYVANYEGNNILVFPGASSLNGAATPRVLTNAQFVNPFGLFVDPGDRLFVINANGVITVFSSASTLSGPVAYDVALTVQGAMMLRTIVTDSNDTGYITDGSNKAVYVYDNVSTRNGMAAPDRTIQGPKTGLSQPVGLFLLER